MVWQRLTRRWKKDDSRQDGKKKRRRRLSMESLAKRELLASDFGAITGTVYNDANNNNSFDAGEVGLANVNVSIAGPVNATVQSDAQGNYRFDDLIAGTYTVTQDPPAPVGFDPEPTASPQTIVLSPAEVAGADILAIDGFDGVTQAVEASANAGGTNPNQSSVVDGTVIGGTRDIFVNVTSAAGIARASSNDPTAGILEIDPSGNGAAVYTVTYDGDNDATTLNATGLAQDLTQGGTGTSAQALLGFDVAPASVGVETFQMIFYTDAANFTTYSFNLPATAAAAPTAEVLLRFNGTGELINGGATEAATVTNTGTGADFTNIGAIQLVVDTDGETAVDGNIDTLRVIGPTVRTADFANDAITPDIAIEKATNGFDADTPTGPSLLVGSTATFTFDVTNPGTVALADVVVVDDNGTPGDNTDDFNPTFIGGDTNNNNRLDVTETWQYSATSVVTEGQYTNISTVSGNPVDANGLDIAGLADPTATDPSNHIGVRAEIEVQKATNGVDADTPTGPQLAVGSTATFTYVVTNPGTVALANVVIGDDNGTPGDNTDDLVPTFTGGDTNNNNRLDVGESWQYSATRVVTAGQYTNISSVSGNPVDANGVDIVGLQDPTDTDPSNHIGVSTGIDIQKATNGVDADTATGPQLGVGTTATFTYNVTNSGTVALANVVVDDDNGTPADNSDDFNPTFVGGDTNNNNRLDVDETWQYSATHVVTAGQYTNISNVTGNPVDANGVDIAALADPTATDPSNHFGVTADVVIEKATNGIDADVATGPVLGVGTTATFTYQVTNPGTVALATVVVTDDNGTPGNTADDFAPTFTGGDTNNNSRLDVTETWTYSATRTVTAGQYTNIANVTGNPVDATGADIADLADPVDVDPSNHFGATADIQIEKSTNGVDADTATGPQLLVGSTATFTFDVTNPGTVALANVVVGDDNGTPGNTADDLVPTFVSGDTNSNNRLDVGETWQYTATRTVTAGQHTNISTVTGNPVDANGVDLAGIADPTDTDPSNHFGIDPQIQIEKATNGVDADTATGPQLAVGATATFTFVVTNPGSVSLANVVVGDDNGTPGNTADDLVPTFTGGDTNGNNRLDVGESWQYTATRVVTAGQHTNISNVTGNPVDANGVDIAGVANPTDTDPSNHIGVVSTIDIEKSTNGQDSDTGAGQQLDVGSTATFSYTVTSTGLALSNVVVTDDNGTPGVTTDDFTPTFNGGDTNNNGLLDQGESWLYSATRIVTVGQYTNIAEATADNPSGGTALLSATDPSSHTGVAPGTTISKRDFLAST